MTTKLLININKVYRMTICKQMRNKLYFLLFTSNYNNIYFQM